MERKIMRGFRFYFFLNAVTFAVVLMLCAAPAIAQDNRVQPSPLMEKNGDDLNAEQIIDVSKPALISIWYHTDSYYDYYSYSSENIKDTTILNGSGFIFSEDGIVGTNYHVIDGIDSILVKTSDGVFYDAQLLLFDEKNDMAILKIKDGKERKFPVVKFGDSDNLKVGQDVFAIGSPLGYEYTISQGIIAGIRDNEKVSFTDPVTYMPVEKNFEKVIQITAAISPGNSGGALFNRKGEVIGITTYTYTGYGNLNFAIAVNSYKKFKNSINLADIENNAEAQKKLRESLFLSSRRLAVSYKDQVTYNWFYVKQKDTMKVIDTFVVRQDSITRLNFLKAENLFNKCIDISPDSFNVYQDLMDLYVYTESFVKAEEFYSVIKEKFSSDSLLNLLSSTLASAYTTNKEYKKALQFYRKMLFRDTNDIYIQYQIANIYEKMGKYRRAIKEYGKVIKNDPGYIQAYVQLGIIYYERLNDFGMSKRYLNYAYEKESIYNTYSIYNTDINYYLGIIAVREGRKLDAILSYLELKNTYTYTPEDNEKKLKLYKAIKKMN